MPCRGRMSLLRLLPSRCFSASRFIFHEPGNDEAEAWLIARNASYRDMIFLIPHYEGHSVNLSYIQHSRKLNLPFKPSVEFLHLVTDFAAIFVLELKLRSGIQLLRCFRSRISSCRRRFFADLICFWHWLCFSLRLCTRKEMLILSDTALFWH